MERNCENCGRRVPEGEQMYTMRIEMFARAEPLVFELQEVLEDHSEAIEELVKEMELTDPEEATDQIYESYSFDLCASCRQRMHRQLKAKAKQKQ